MPVSCWSGINSYYFWTLGVLDSKELSLTQAVSSPSSHRGGPVRFRVSACEIRSKVALGQVFSACFWFSVSLFHQCPMFMLLTGQMCEDWEPSRKLFFIFFSPINLGELDRKILPLSPLRRTWSDVYVTLSCVFWRHRERGSERVVVELGGKTTLYSMLVQMWLTHWPVVNSDSSHLSFCTTVPPAKNNHRDCI